MVGSVDKKSFLMYVPGFRSGTWWKKAIAGIVYLFILLAIIGTLTPGPSVEDEVKSARKYVSENNYRSAVFSYKTALGKWEASKSYPFSREEIEKELKEVRTPYAKQLLVEARQILDAGDIVKAEAALKMAQMEDSNLEEIRAVSDQIAKANALTKANRLLDEALASLNSNKTEEAIFKFREAVSLVSDNPRNAEIKEKLAPTIKNKTKEYIAASIKSLNEWNISDAEVKIELIAVFDPENSQLEGLKKRLSDTQATLKEIGPKPVNSAWDAAVSPVQDFLKRNLKDPGSVQYDEWSAVFMADYGGKKCWAVRCRYRAKNSFGGYVLSNQIFYIRNDTVIGYRDF